MEKKLKRMLELRALQNYYLSKENEVAAFSDELMNEFLPLQEELVTHFLPLVEQLVDAGLINVEVETTDMMNCFETRYCYKNGNIVLNIDGEESVMDFDKNQLDEKDADDDTSLKN